MYHRYHDIIIRIIMNDTSPIIGSYHPTLAVFNYSVLIVWLLLLVMIIHIEQGIFIIKKILLSILVMLCVFNLNLYKFLQILNLNFSGLRIKSGCPGGTKTHQGKMGIHGRKKSRISIWR